MGEQTLQALIDSLLYHINVNVRYHNLSSSLSKYAISEIESMSKCDNKDVTKFLNGVVLLKTYILAYNIVNMSLDWHAKYVMIFSEKISQRVSTMIDLDYYDPDMSYEDDIKAYMAAFREKLVSMFSEELLLAFEGESRGETICTMSSDRHLKSGK